MSGAPCAVEEAEGLEDALPLDRQHHPVEQRLERMQAGGAVGPGPGR